MQSWQVFPVVLVIAVFAYAFTMRKKLGAKAAQVYGDAMAAFRTEVGRRPDERDPIFIMATERKMLSAKLFHIAVSDRRFVVKLAGNETRSFDRGSIRATIRKKRFADVGNMQTTYSTGWELAFALPDGTKHTCRVYDAADGIPDHPAHVQALAAMLPAP